MPQLTWYMKRPKGFKKEYTMDKPPNFEEISRRNPLPEIERLENHFPPNERPRNGELMNVNDKEMHVQVPQILNENALRLVMIQPVNPLLIQMQYAVYLRELRLRQQLVSMIAGNRPARHGNRNNSNHSLVEGFLLANLMHRMQ